MKHPLMLSTIFAASALSAAHELDGRDLDRGENLYGEHCAACHGANLEGQPDWKTPDENGVLPAPPHDKTGHTWHHDNDLLFQYTKFGGQEALAKRGIVGFKSGMPGLAEALSDEDIWDVLAYIRSTWPKRVQDIQKMRNPPHR